MNLSLRNKVRLVIVAAILLWFLSHALFVGLGNFLEGREFWTLLLAMVIGIVSANLIVRRAMSRYGAAMAREDLQAARREYETLKDFWRRRGRETIKTYGINIVILEGRYRDAFDQLQALDMKRIGKKGAPAVTIQIAWCLAQLGEPAKALELAQSVLAQLESMGPQFTGSGHLVIGTSCLFLGKHEEAVSHLEQANNTTFASRKSVASFYLGECYTALGDSQKARLAYEQAHEPLPKGKFGMRALEHFQ
jgi:tetratricopeptide (TPR) repeat protein